MKHYLQIFSLTIFAFVLSSKTLAQGGQGGPGQSTTQQGVFKFHVYISRYHIHKMMVFKYKTDAFGNKLQPVRVQASELQIGKLKKPTLMNITNSKDTLYLNLYLRKKNPNLIYDEPPVNNRPFVEDYIHYDSGTYDPNVAYTYYVELRNRQYASFNYTDIEASAITAPLKIRFPAHFAGGLNINTELTPSANINLNAQVRIGKVTYSYDKYGGMTTKSAYSGVFGGFIGLGALQLTGVNTKSSVLIAPNDTAGIAAAKTLMVPSFSFGASFGVNFYGVEIGALFGYEVPFQWRSIWDYRNVPFIGFGIGYGIPFVN